MGRPDRRPDCTLLRALAPPRDGPGVPNRWQCAPSARWRAQVRAHPSSNRRSVATIPHRCRNRTTQRATLEPSPRLCCATSIHPPKAATCRPLRRPSTACYGTRPPTDAHHDTTNCPRQRGIGWGNAAPDPCPRLTHVARRKRQGGERERRRARHGRTPSGQRSQWTPLNRGGVAARRSAAS